MCRLGLPIRPNVRQRCSLDPGSRPEAGTGGIRLRVLGMLRVGRDAGSDSRADHGDRRGIRRVFPFLYRLEPVPAHGPHRAAHLPSGRDTSCDVNPPAWRSPGKISVSVGISSQFGRRSSQTPPASQPGHAAARADLNPQETPRGASRAPAWAYCGPEDPPGKEPQPWLADQNEHLGAAPCRGGGHRVVRFWNEVLAPKSTGFGTHPGRTGWPGPQRKAVFPRIAGRPPTASWTRLRGFGDTRPQVGAHCGPRGRRRAIELLHAFSAAAEADREQAGIGQPDLLAACGDRPARREPRFRLSRASGRCSSPTRGAGLSDTSPRAEARRCAWRTSSGARPTTIPGCRWPRTSCCATCRHRAKTPGPAGRDRSRWPMEPMVRKMMEVAGYENVTFERVDAPVLIGKDVRDALEFQLAIARPERCSGRRGPEAEAKRGEIEAALAEAIRRQTLARGRHHHAELVLGDQRHESRWGDSLTAMIDATSLPPGQGPLLRSHSVMRRDGAGRVQGRLRRAVGRRAGDSGPSVPDPGAAD